MTDAEKQPYKQEAIDARAAYEVKREEYWKNIDYKKVNEINRRRRAKGKTTLRRVISAEDKLPMSSFLRYMVDFRTSPAGQAIKAEGGMVVRNWSKAAGANWAKFSDAEKFPYVEIARKDKEAWDAKHPKA